MSEEERDRPRQEVPFDEDPPVDPSVPQVGNSRARFVLPADEADREEADDGAPAERTPAEPAPAEPERGAGE